MWAGGGGGQITETRCIRVHVRDVFSFFINISFGVPPDIPKVASALELADSSADPAKIGMWVKIYIYIYIYTLFYLKQIFSLKYYQPLNY